MPSLPARGVHSTYAEYLEIEAASPIRHEYLAGEILAMAGGTPEHAALQVAVSGALLRQLTGRPCRVFSSDLRLRVPATGLATYAGVTVVCGRVERDAEDENAVVNRIVLVEITSKRTEAYDRGEKFEHYRTIPSLREYLIVSHREPRIDLWRRPASGGAWAEMRAGAGDSALLESIDCRLDVDEVFADAGDDLDAEEREALHAALDRAWAGARAGIFGPPTTSSRSSAPGNDDSRPRHARGGGAGGASSGRPPRGLRVWSEGVGVALTGPP